MKRVTRVAAAILSLVALPLSAQTVNERPAIEEVIVTASKRGDTTLMDTPMAVQALSGQELEMRGVTQFEDYARTISGLSFEEQGPGDKRIVLRGLQSTGAATTGVYFDDMVITGANRQDGGGRQPDIRLVDMERIEVLKGPQGTLYGASSMSGTIRMITNKPDPTEVSGAFNTGFGVTEYASGENHHYDAMLNVPVIEDELAARVVGYGYERAGFIDDLLVGETGALGANGVNTHEVQGGRVAVRWLPSDDVSLDLMWISQDTKADGPAWYQPAYGEFVQLNHTLAPWDESLTGVNFALNWDMNHGIVTASFSDMERDLFYNWPATRVLCTLFGNSNDVCFAPENAVQYETHASVDQPQNRGIMSSELRYASLWEGPLQLVGGVFYQKEDAEFTSRVIDVDLFGNRIPFPENTNVNRYVVNQTEQLAAFGELSYDVTDTLTATLGMRAFRFDINEVGQNLVTRNRPVPDDPVFTNSEEEDVTWKFSLSYDLNEGRDLMYFNYAEGFRSGGNNEPDFETGTVLPPYSSDSLQSYELGAKGLFFDGSLQLDVAAYYMEWEDLQARVDAEIEGSSFLILGNVGAATVTGAEVGALLVPVTGLDLTLGGNLTLLEAELSEDDPSGRTGLDGDRIPDVPKVTANVFADYGFDVPGEWRAVTRVDYSYVGDSYSDFRPESPFYREQGDYSLVNLRMTLDKERYRVAFYVDNAFDERAIMTWFAEQRRPDEVYPLRPRTFGIDLGYRF